MCIRHEGEMPEGDLIPDDPWGMRVKHDEDTTPETAVEGDGVLEPRYISRIL